MTDTGFVDPLQTLMSVRKGTLSRIAQPRRMSC